MSKYSLRRILSLLLAVLLVCTLLPAAALAEDGAGTDDPAPKAEEEDTPETTAPAKPSAEEVEALFTNRALLEVQCTNPNHKASAIHSLLPGCYEITDVVETGGDLGYTCHVKISSAAGSAYVKLHDANTGASRPHMSLGGGVDHWLKYDGAAKKWTFVNEMEYTSVIYAVCPPDDSLVREWELRITCGKCKDDGKQIFWRDVALSNGEYSVGEVKQDGSGYYCEITVKAEKYVAAFSNEINIGKYHALAEGEAAEKTFKVRFDGRRWPDNLYTIKDAFTVTCDAIPPEPAAPTDAFIKKNTKISVNCPKGTHSNKEYYVGYDLMDGTYEIGDVVYDANLRVYTCTVTLTQPEKYLEMYDRYTGKPHIWQSASTEIKLFYNYNTAANKEWRFKDHTFLFEVSCDTAAPEKPGDAVVMELLKNAVSVSCKNDAAAHDAETYDLLEGTYTIGDVTLVGGYYTCTVTVQPERYVTKYNAAFAYAGHALSPAGQTGSVTLRYDGGSWTVSDDASAPVVFEVDCAADPPAKPGEKDVGLGYVWVECRDDPDNHSRGISLNDVKDGYTIGEVRGNAADGYTCGITVDVEPYFDCFRKEHIAYKYHALIDGGTEKRTFTATYKNGRWEYPHPALTLGAACRGVQPPAPDKPGDDFLTNEENVQIRFYCSTAEGVHSPFLRYALTAGGYTAGEPYYRDGDYYCDITVSADEGHLDRCLKEHNDKTGKTHTVTGEKTCTLTFCYNLFSGAWENYSERTFDFNVVCEIPGAEGPEKPAGDELAALLGENAVSVRCQSVIEKAHGTETSPLLDGTYTIGDVAGSADRGYICTLTVQPEKYIEAINSHTNASHALFPAGQTGSLTLEYDDANGKWTTQEGSKTVRFYVVCDAVPARPDAEEIWTNTENLVFVNCRKKDEHTLMYKLIPGTYTVGEVTMGDGGYQCIVTLTDPERYVEEFNAMKESDPPHALFRAERDKIMLAYDGGSRTWGDAKNWISVEVDCTAYSVTYTDGADGEAFADKVYKDLPYGAETPGFAGTPEREHYVFAGWTPAVTDTVSGDVTYTAVWTPVTYTVSYELDGGTAQGNPESYTVESGSFTLKNPARNGYTFTGWSGTGLDGENNMTVTVEKGSAGDRAYTAHWRRSAASSGGSAVRSYTIRASASDGGTISPSGSVSVGEGGSRTFTFTPDKGYALCNVLVDGKEIGAAESHTFQNVRSGHTVEAVFMKEDGNPKNGVTASGKPAAETFEESTPEERREKLEAARKANGDAAAWLYIPAAEIDMPVLQTENNAFYLRMGADKKYAPWGSVYADCRAGLQSRETLGANTAIFGASAADGDPDGECFSKLFRYLEAEFVEENPYIYLMLADGEELVFRIGACFVTDTEFDYIRPAFETDGAWKTYLETVEKKNLFAFTGAALEKGDTLLTLTTYSEAYDTDKTGEQRFAVVAKLLPDGEDTAAYTVKNAENPELP